MRDKIAMIIELAQEQAATMEPNAADAVWSIDPWECGDKILALFPSLDGIVVEEECPECWGSNDCVDANCITCNGTGTITRPATVEDIFRVFKILMEDGLTEVNMGEHGMLRVKE